MNLQDREQLTTFLQQLTLAQAGAKVEEAQAMIAEVKAQLAQQRPVAAASSFLDATTWGRQPSPVLSSPPCEQPACSGGSSCPAITVFASYPWISGVRFTVQHIHHDSGGGRRRFVVPGNPRLVGSHHHSLLGVANPLSSPGADNEAPANNFLDAPTDTSSSIPDNRDGFNE